MEIFQNILIFIIGSMFGSAANALIDRLPRNESWFSGRSHCDKCEHTLEFKDLIPIISYLSLLPIWKILNSKSEIPNKSKTRNSKCYQAGCRYCGAPIPYRNFLVEIFLGIGFVVVFQFYSFPIAQLLMGILWVTTIIAVMDWETKLVSEVMVAVWGVLVLVYQLTSFSVFQLSWSSSLVGLVVGVGVIGGLWAVTRGKAMGFGDVEIAAVMGWWLGWPQIAIGLWIAFIVGAVVGVIKLINKTSKLKSEIAFGPFLVTGAWVGWMWGNAMLNALVIR